MINRTMSMKRLDLVSLKPFPNPAIENLSHSQLKMMSSTGPSNSICFFLINCMLEGKYVKLAFHTMVANYWGNLVVSFIILDVAICLAIRSMFTYKYFRTTILNYSMLTNRRSTQVQT